MEVYVLDSLLRRTEVYDVYQSLIWSERWRDIGEFQLDLASTRDARTQFTQGTRLAINNSHRVMTVETIEDTISPDGEDTLKIKGRSLEAILIDRAAMQDLDTLLWTLTNYPADVAREMFDHICRTGALDLADKIPFLQPGTMFPASTIPEPGAAILWEQKPASLYAAEKALCDAYDLGFRLVRNFDTSELYFDIYTGNDRTTQQAIFPPVVFSPNLDNLQNTTEFSSIENSKNVAYVTSAVGSEIVYGENVDPDVEGFDRRVLMVETSDVTEETLDIPAALQQIGTEELQKTRAISLFDGEVNQYDQYVYGVDYGLGDLVELRNRDGIITYKRVTEQIFVSDGEGERSYPTLALDLFAGANTWLWWNNKPTVWEDFADETWADMD